MFGLIVISCTDYPMGRNNINRGTKAGIFTCVADSLIAITLLAVGILAVTGIISISPAAAFCLVGGGSVAILYQIRQLISILKTNCNAHIKPTHPLIIR